MNKFAKKFDFVLQSTPSGHGLVKEGFTLIELLVVIAMIAMFPRSKSSFFLPFSAI